MTTPEVEYDLLRDLEQRQDDVLAQLDDLNARIERLLATWAPAALKPLATVAAQKADSDSLPRRLAA
ncbi:MAG: hypothetical protein JSS27_13850 [Planctomycetes bacterium]|nr:hypothetical protein [Planctomycetota bacterium]